MVRPACPPAVSWAACSECSSSAKRYALDDRRNSLEMPTGVAGIISTEMGGLEAGGGARSALRSRVRPVYGNSDGGKRGTRRGMQKHVTSAREQIRSTSGVIPSLVVVVAPSCPPEHEGRQRAPPDPPPTTGSCHRGHAPGWRWPRRAAPWRAPQPRGAGHGAARRPPAAAAAGAAAGAERGARPPEPSRRRG